MAATPANEAENRVASAENRLAQLLEEAAAAHDKVERLVAQRPGGSASQAAPLTLVCDDGAVTPHGHAALASIHAEGSGLVTLDRHLQSGRTALATTSRKYSPSDDGSSSLAAFDQLRLTELSEKVRALTATRERRVEVLAADSDSDSGGGSEGNSGRRRLAALLPPRAGESALSAAASRSAAAKLNVEDQKATARALRAKRTVERMSRELSDARATI